MRHHLVRSGWVDHSTFGKRVPSDYAGVTFSARAFSSCVAAPCKMKWSTEIESSSYNRSFTEVDNRRPHRDFPVFVSRFGSVTRKMVPGFNVYRTAVRVSGEVDSVKSAID